MSAPSAEWPFLRLRCADDRMSLTMCDAPLCASWTDPFDVQTIRLDISVPGATLSCDAIAAQIAELPVSDIVPASSPWILSGAITATHPSESLTSRCLVEVPVQRDSTVYVVQRLIPLMLIGGGALFALFINPTAAPAPGARMGILLSTMVLISLKSNSDLGLGTLTYLLWIDLLKMCQFAILLSAVVETALVHHISGKGNIPKALQLDRTVRIILPFVLYPWIVGCMVLIGFEDRLPGMAITGIAMFGVGFVSIVLYGLRVLDRARRKRHATRLKVANSLITADLTSDDSIPTLEEAFKFFDGDGSGAIDMQELHLLMSLVFPKLNRLQVQREIKAMAIQTPVIFEDFAEALQSLQQRIKEKASSKSPASPEVSRGPNLFSIPPAPLPPLGAVVSPAARAGAASTEEYPESLSPEKDRLLGGPLAA